MVALSGFKDYDHFESSSRTFRRKADTPIEVVGSVWAVRAPVDLFVHIKYLFLGYPDDLNSHSSVIVFVQGTQYAPYSETLGEGFFEAFANYLDGKPD